ncbi:MAG: right-handed parallel beta-helix repeat-containing protein, partial [Candidatus Bathyarchaeales archaeon]
MGCKKELSMYYAKAQQSIQTLIDNASPGSTINVSSGTYAERIVINKPLTIVGESPNNTVIFGYGTGVLVDIVSDNVTLINFTLENNGGCGIRIAGFKNIVISNNFVESNNQGISIRSAQDINITWNKFAKNYEGIEISNSSNIIISENFFDESYGPGVLCYVSSGVTMHSNFIINNYAYATYLEGV